MIGTPKPICRHPLENTVTVTLKCENGSECGIGMDCPEVVNTQHEFVSK